MGRPSRPRFGRRGHVNIGSSGGAGVAVVTTPNGPAVTLEPATAVVPGVDPGVGAVIFLVSFKMGKKNFFEFKFLFQLSLTPSRQNCLVYISYG